MPNPIIVSNHKYIKKSPPPPTPFHVVYCLKGWGQTYSITIILVSFYDYQTKKQQIKNHPELHMNQCFIQRWNSHFNISQIQVKTLSINSALKTILYGGMVLPIFSIKNLVPSTLSCQDSTSVSFWVIKMYDSLYVHLECLRKDVIKTCDRWACLPLLGREEVLFFLLEILNIFPRLPIYSLLSYLPAGILPVCPKSNVILLFCRCPSSCCSQMGRLTSRWLLLDLLGCTPALTLWMGLVLGSCDTHFPQQ